MVLSKIPVPGRPTIWMIVGQGPFAIAESAGGRCLAIFSLFLFSSLSPSLWKTARYILKYCLRGPLNPKQPINQPTKSIEGNLMKLDTLIEGYKAKCRMQEL